jgi:hypothetical protein
MRTDLCAEGEHGSILGGSVAESKCGDGAVLVKWLQSLSQNADHLYAGKEIKWHKIYQNELQMVAYY